MLLPEIAGSGAALFDYDGDGAMDVFLVGGYPTSSAGQAAGPTCPPAGNRAIAFTGII